MELFPYVQLSNLVATKEDAANRGVADGYAALDSAGRVPLSQIPTDVTGLINTVQLTSEKDQANGYAALDAARRIATNRLPANVGTVAADWPTYKPRIPPSGGGKDMVLTKSSSTNYDYTWQLPPGAQDLSALQSDVAELEDTVASLPLSSILPWSSGTAPATAVRKHLNSIWWTPEATSVEPGYDYPFPLHTDVAGWTTSGCLSDRSEGIVSNGNAVAVSTTGIPIAQLDGFSVSFQIKGDKANGFTALGIAYDNAIGTTDSSRGIDIWATQISTTVLTPVRLECTYEGTTLTLRLYVNDILRNTVTGNFVATHFYLRFHRYFNGFWQVKGPFTGQGAPKAPWLKVVDMDEYRKLPWAVITGKPTTYPPATHTHAWGDITGKPSTFAPSAHTHTKSQITDLGPQLPTTGLTVGDTLTWNGTTWVGGPGGGSSIKDRRWLAASSDVSIDEFESASLAAAWGFTAYSSYPSAALPTYTQAAGVLSVKYGPNTGSGNAEQDGNGGNHAAIVRPLSGAGGSMAVGDAFYTAYVGHSANNDDYRMGGLVLSTTGTTGGQQILHRWWNGWGNSRPTGLRALSDWRGDSGVGVGDRNFALPVTYSRLVRISSTTWRADLSPDGVSWLHGDVFTWEQEPTHVGFADSNWNTGRASVIAYQFLRRQSGIV